MKSAAGRALLLAFVGIFTGGACATEILDAARAEHGFGSCRCGSDCACRSAEKGCKRCYTPLSMKARCGCCGSGPHLDGAHYPRDTVLADVCHMGAPLLIWSPARDLDDHRLWQPPSKQEHPPRQLPQSPSQPAVRT